MPRNSQSPPSAVDRTSSLSVGCAPTSSRIGVGTVDDRVRQRAEALDLDGHDVTGLHRPAVRRGAGEDQVAGQQRDRAGEVGDEVVHVPRHLVGAAVLADLAVDERADPLAAEVPVGDERRADRAQRVAALHAQHRAGVGVAEVVQAEVVADRVAGDVARRRLVGRDVAARPADHDHDLALVVQPLAPLGAHDGPAVGVQRRRRLLEVRRRGRQLDLELAHPADVVEVHADDLRRLAGGR